MKGFSTLLLIVAGIVISPFMVGLTDHFISDAPRWFAYAVPIIFAGVIYAVGIDILRPIALSIVIGVVLFGLGIQYYPQRLDWIGVDVPKPF